MGVTVMLYAYTMSQRWHDVLAAGCQLSTLRWRPLPNVRFGSMHYDVRCELNTRAVKVLVLTCLGVRLGAIALRVI